MVRFHILDVHSLDFKNEYEDEFEKKGDIERADLIRSVSNKITIINQNYLSIESTDGLGNTALLFAAKEGRLKMVKDLIKAGANIYATNNKGENFYDVAVNRFKFINNVKDWIEKTYPELIMANKYNL
jgi:ankyrin repeat protein